MSTANELYEAGRQKKADGDLEGAVEQWRAALAEDAGHLDAKKALATVLYDEGNRLKEQGDVEAAVAKWREIIAFHPEHVLTHMALGVHLQRLGQFDDAIRHAVRVTELEPNDPFSYTQLSVIYQRCGRIPEAEEAMARAHAVQQHGH